MQGIATQNFVPFQSLSATLPPEEDLDLRFELKELTQKSRSDCGAQVLVTCSDFGVDIASIEFATLIWKHCGVVYTYETETSDLIIEDNEVVAILFSVDDFNLSNVNDFELTVFAQGITTSIGRGRIFINIVPRITVTPEPEPEPPDSGEEWVILEIPNGAINGSNATFVTDFAFIPETLTVYVNGLQQSKPDDWNNTDDQTIVLTFSLEVGEEIAVTYQKA